MSTLGFICLRSATPMIDVRLSLPCNEQHVSIGPLSQRPTTTRKMAAAMYGYVWVLLCVCPYPTPAPSWLKISFGLMSTFSKNVLGKHDDDHFFTTFATDVIDDSTTGTHYPRDRGDCYLRYPGLLLIACNFSNIFVRCYFVFIERRHLLSPMRSAPLV